MDNRNKENDQKSNQSPNINTKVLNTKEEKVNTALEEKKNNDTLREKKSSTALKEKKSNTAAEEKNNEVLKEKKSNTTSEEKKNNDTLKEKKSSEALKAKKISATSEEKKSSEALKAKKISAISEEKKSSEALKAKKISAISEAKNDEALKVKKINTAAEEKKSSEALKAKKINAAAEEKKNDEALKVKKINTTSEVKKNSEVLKAKKINAATEEKKNNEALKAKKINAASEERDSEVLKAKKINPIFEEKKRDADFDKTVSKDAGERQEIKGAEVQPKSEKKDNPETNSNQKNEKETVDNKTKQDVDKKDDTLSRESVKSLQKEKKNDSVKGKSVTDFSSEHIKGIAKNAAKILLPVAAWVIVIAVILSYAFSHKSNTAKNTSLNVEDNSDAAGIAVLNDEPLAENAYANINDLMRTFYTALADGDMDTVRALKDYNTDKEIITYEKKSEFIESYDNVNCYTKPGVEENSYFVYATYDVKIKDIATEAPGLNAFYVYTADDGSLKIDGDTEENIRAAFKLVTNQDDVVDLYNKIDVNYTEATASDEALEQFMAELPKEIKESVGIALAQLETQDEVEDTPQTDAEDDQTQSAETPNENEEPFQNKVVNQIVRTTDTVNVRSSDSEEADKIGKAQTGTEFTRVEERVNGWSKVVFEGRDAYIKSDYLEVVTTAEAADPIGTVTAITNVNVRNQASQEAERIGSVQEGDSYNLLEDQGEWYKIDYNGTTGFVKAEFFSR